MEKFEVPQSNLKENQQKQKSIAVRVQQSSFKVPKAISNQQISVVNQDVVNKAIQ
jgi:hypothetical protein